MIEKNLKKEAKEKPVPSWSNTKEITLIVGGSILLAIIIIAIVALIYFCYRRQNRKALKASQTFQDIAVSKSAPLSRQATPKPARRLSCPLLQPHLSKGSGSSCDSVDFTLTERVQPKSISEQGYVTNPVLEQQYSFIENEPTDPYASGMRTSDDEDDSREIPRGSLLFSTQYDYDKSSLIVKLITAENLPGRGRQESPRTPFVKIFLLPDEESCVMSKSCGQTLNPVFNETFDFQVSEEECSQRALRFSVYEIDKRKVRHSLGHVFVSLSELDLASECVVSRPLETLLTTSQTLGEVLLSLAYIPQEGKLKVAVNKARNTQIEPGNGMYMKVEFYHGRRLCKTKRTAIRKGTFDPEFNESFSFNIKTRQIDSCNVVITANIATSTENIYTDEAYGKVTLGPFTVCRGEELIHWNEAMSNTRQTVTKWHHFTVPKAENE